MATELLQVSRSYHANKHTSRKFSFSYKTSSNVLRIQVNPLLHGRRTSHLRLNPGPKLPRLIVSNAIEFKSPGENSSVEQRQRRADSSVLLDVNGMMCGACVSRVRSLLHLDDRVESAVVNMLTETAAIRLKPEVVGSDSSENVAEHLARRLTECGFSSKVRVSGIGVAENVKKYKEMAEKKQTLLANSRNRVAFAWTLVALCCGSHASHILHSLGIHIAHGSFWEVLHNSYVKGGLALGALLGPGRGSLAAC